MRWGLGGVQFHAEPLTPPAVRSASWSAGGVTYAVKARHHHAPGASWDPHRHPRDKDGRFIHVGGTVRLPGGGTGRVTGVTRGGKVNVQRADGTAATVAADAVQVTRGATGRRVPDPNRRAAVPRRLATDTGGRGSRSTSASGRARRRRSTTSPEDQQIPAKFDAEVVKAAESLKLPAGLHAELDNVSGGPRSFALRILDRHGDQQALFVRHMGEDNDGYYVAHEEAEVAPAWQRKGIATHVNATFEEAYRRAGINRIYLIASSGKSGSESYNGGYTWARAGYDWDTRNLRRAARDVDDLLTKLARDVDAQGRDPELMRQVGEMRVAVVRHKDDPSYWPTPLELTEFGGDTGVGREFMLNHTWSGMKRLDVQAKAPRKIDAKDLPAGTPTARPALYGYQRDLISHIDTSGSVDAQQAAARIRERMPLSAGQAAALADAVRAHTQDAPDLHPSRRRGMDRLAMRLDAVHAELAGGEPPEVEGRQVVNTIAPRDVLVGDNVALPGRGGAVLTGQVTFARSVSGGRLVELYVRRDTDGQVEHRMVTRDSSLYLLPDRPDPVPLPPAKAGPVRELITPDRVNPGDRLDFGVVSNTVTAVRRRKDGRTEIKLAANDPADKDTWIRDRESTDGLGTLVRTARGDRSATQPWDAAMPAEDPRTVTAGELAVGDRIHTPEGGDGYIQELSGGNLGRGVTATVRWDNGTTRDAAWPTKDTEVTRLLGVTTETLHAQQAAKAERERYARANLVRSSFDELTAEFGNWLLDVPVGNQDNMLSGLEVLSDQHESYGFDPDTLARRLAPDAERDTRRALAIQLGQVADEYLTDLISNVRTGLTGLPLTDDSMDARIARSDMLDQLRKNPPPITPKIADTLSRIDFSALTTERALPEPVRPDARQLRDRLDAYRAAIPGGAERLGQARVRVAVLDDITLADLKAGKVPQSTWKELWTPDRAADGGPGAATMANLDTIKAAGADLDAELTRRINDAGGADMAAERQRAKDAYDKGFTRMENSRTAVSTVRAEVTRKILADAGVDATTRDELGQVFRDAKLFTPEWEKLNRLRSELPHLVDAAPEMKKARAELDAAHQAFPTLDKAYADMAKRLAALRREHTVQMLNELRDGGAGGVHLTYRSPKGAQLTERSQLVQAMRQAEAVYPTAWLERMRDKRGGYELKKVARGYHTWGGGTIALSEDRNSKFGPMAATADHELGHGMEEMVPGLVAAEEAFLWARTASGEVGSRTRPKREHVAGGRRDEYGFRDEFPDHYSGKDYLHPDGSPRAFEIFTMGKESLTSGSTYLDEDYRRWLLGALFLL